ncbi:MAG TPA: sulfotransferase domain-containing protein [Sphingomicrobium sp.]|nr:sulfotransferase domain-containing protein [Sphingomicrobium sp.]
MSTRHDPLKTLALGTVAQVLRLVPGSAALRWKRDLRDAAWLADADAVVVSFPKSGRTFVRAMLARLFQLKFGFDERKLLDFPSLKRAARGVPRLLFVHAGDAMREPDEIRVDAADYAHCKIILLARHPADVAVSRYHHLKHRSRDRARRRLAERPLETFIWTEKGGIPSIVAFLNAWAELRPTIVRYEDFLIEPEQTLGALAEAVGLEVTPEQIADAATFGSFDNLKQREREGYFRSSRLKPAKKGDERSQKVRSGGSGGYRARLGEVEAERIDAYISEHLDPIFGYSKA